MFTLWLSLPLALAAGQAKGKAKGHEKQTGAHVTSHRFHDPEVAIIINFYGPGTGNLPPGLAKRSGDLPPGLEKHLRRDGTLPPGLRKRLDPFPPALDARLGPVPVGYRRVMMDSWALLIHDATNVIADIIDLTRAK
jgi:hypothetical protein